MTRAVILDRDGVINDNHRDPNVNRPDQFILFEHTAQAIQKLNQAGFLVLVATNQGGVGLKYMSKQALDEIHEYMKERLFALGAVIDDVAACIHAPHAGCSCRKPKPGLLLELEQRYHFDLLMSYMVGDRETDVEAGIAAGTKTVYIGEGNTKANFKCSNLLEAVEWILVDALTDHP